MAAAALPSLTEHQAISHDFINALASVRSLSELLVDYPGLDDGARESFLKLIHKETERLTRLLVQLNHAPDRIDPL